MGTPGQELIASGILASGKKARWNRAGIQVDGHPEYITIADPPDSYAGASAINSPERVDLVVDSRDKSRLNIKYTAEAE